MSGPLPKVRFILAWQNYRVGDVIQPAGLLRDWLIGNGYCDKVLETNTVKVPMVQRPRITSRMG